MRSCRYEVMHGNQCTEQQHEELVMRSMQSN